MFDTTSITTGSVSHSVTFNSVAGTLVKSTPDSKFIRFHMESSLADTFFDKDEPCRKEASYPYTKTKVSVLQVMLCGNDQFLVEYLDIKET